MNRKTKDNQVLDKASPKEALFKSCPLQTFLNLNNNGIYHERHDYTQPPRHHFGW